MSEIRFNDGAVYERGMGRWSGIAGEIFLDWIAPAPGLRWLDVGCGNGAFTELLARRVAPAALEGVDPSAAQLAYARSREGCAGAMFRTGDALALPYPDGAFDVAVMALVIHFVPDPAKGVSELARVVRPGGLVCAYAWDIPNGGFPFQPMQDAIAAVGYKQIDPPSANASPASAMHRLWDAAGLEAVTSWEFPVHREFADFDALWLVCSSSSSVMPSLAKMSAAEIERAKEGLRERYPGGSDGAIVLSARATAVRGTVPAL